MCTVSIVTDKNSIRFPRLCLVLGFTTVQPQTTLKYMRPPVWVFRRADLERVGVYNERFGCTPGYCLIQRDRVRHDGVVTKMFAVYSEAQYKEQMLMPTENIPAATESLEHRLRISDRASGYSGSIYYGLHKTPSVLILDLEFKSGSEEGKIVKALTGSTVLPSAIPRLEELGRLFDSDVVSLVGIVKAGFARCGYPDISYSVHKSAGLKPSAHAHFHDVLFSSDRQKHAWLRTVCGGDLDVHPRASCIVDWTTLNRSSGAMRIPGFAKTGTDRVLARDPYVYDSEDTRHACVSDPMFLYPWQRTDVSRPVMAVCPVESPVVVRRDAPEPAVVPYSAPAVLLTWVRACLDSHGVSAIADVVPMSYILTVDCQGCECPNSVKRGRPHRNRLCVYINHKGLVLCCSAPSCRQFDKPWKSVPIPIPDDVEAAIKQWYPAWDAQSAGVCDIGDDAMKAVSTGVVYSPCAAWGIPGCAGSLLTDSVRIIEHPDGEGLVDFFGDDCLGMGTDRHTLIVEAPKGFGKTKKLVDFVRAKCVGKDVLFITNRRILAVSLFSRFAELGAMLYTDNSWRDERGILVFQLDSIWKIQKGRQFDVVVLDEVSTTLPHFEFQCMKKPGVVWDSFLGLCRDAKKLVALDAFISPREVNIISLIRGASNTTLRKYLSRPAASKISYVYHEDADGFDTSILEEIEHGKNVFVATLSRAFGEGLRLAFTEKFGPDGVFMYSSLTRDDVKREHFIDVEAHWSKFRLVIITPTCNAGISFEVPGYFHSVWLYACRGSASPATLLQMGARVRDVHDGVVHIGLYRMRFLPAGVSSLLDRDMGLQSLLGVLRAKSGALGTELSIREQLLLYNTREKKLAAVAFPNVLVSLLAHMGVTSLTVVRKGPGLKRKRQDTDGVFDPSTYNVTSQSVQGAALLTPAQRDLLTRIRERGEFISDFDASCIVKSALADTFECVIPPQAIDAFCANGCRDLSRYMWTWKNLGAVLRSTNPNPFVYSVDNVLKRRRITDTDHNVHALNARYYAGMLGLNAGTFVSGVTLDQAEFSKRWESEDHRTHFETNVAHVTRAWDYYYTQEGEGRVMARRLAVCDQFLSRYGFKTNVKRAGKGNKHKTLWTRPVFNDLGMQQCVEGLSDIGRAVVSTFNP